MDTFNIEQFHFLRPWWFLAILPLIALLYRQSQKRLSEDSWQKVVDSALQPFVLNTDISGRRQQSWLIGLAGIMAITALAGPVWEKIPQPLFRNQAALVVALDLSRSMDATDLNPSRLSRARFKIADLVKQRKDGQTALLVYAKDAYLVTPLTNDADTILAQLQVLETNLMPRQGSRADRAIEKGIELLKQGGLVTGDILLVTDSVDSANDVSAAITAVSQGYRVHVLAMGTKAGAPIPTGNGNFLSDEEGKIVLPVMDQGALKRVATSGHGTMVLYRASDQDIKELLNRFEQREPNPSDGMNEQELKNDVWYEVGPALLVLMIPLAAYGFRRGNLLSVLFIPLLLAAWLSPAPVLAADSWWQRADQQAAEKFEETPASAAELFDDPDWRGAAHFRAKDYDKALESWSQGNSAESWYNRGNAHAQMGQYPEALEAYEQALSLKQDFEDAQYNLDAVKKAMEEMNQDQQQEQEQKNDDKKDQSKEGEGDQDKQGDQSEQKQDEQSDQQSSDGGQEDPSDQQEQQDSQGQSESGKSEGEKSGEKPSEQEQDSESSDKKKDAQAAMGENESSHDEDEQTTEAILRVIPDDPGGLLKRKFQYQYQQRDGRIRSSRDESGEAAW